jgi:transcriptional regulator with PAS, ATPase and Fis domain
LRQNDVLFSPVVHSDVMRTLDRIVRQVAPRDVVVTLVGESGTGKEVLARRVHELSSRRAEPFVPINCAAIPEALFESELFGHERGAFTGATERQRGKVEVAAGGTLFLDEIGEMPLAMQAKMLRFLENRRFMRVGGTAKLVADVRLVCATLRPLEAEVAAGRFRGDLYYRIQGISLDVPPLRSRRADLAALVEQILAEVCARHGLPIPRISRDVRLRLMEYPWPGNVRELRNVLERVSILREGKIVRVEDLPPALRGESVPDGSETITLSLRERLDSMVEQIVAATLVLHQGRRGEVARSLGVSVRTLERWLGASRRASR